MRSVSVILATMNRPSDVRSVLESLLTQTLTPLEILIVDQSQDDLTQKLTSDFRNLFAAKDVRLEYLRQEEKSLVKARNLGISTAAGDLISFVDDDAVLHSDYYEKIDFFLNQHPDVGAISGSQILPTRPEGFKWKARQMIMRIFMISNCDGRITPSGFGYPLSFEKEIDRLLYVDMLPGCNMNFTKEAIGSDRFDEWFSGYGFREDADFSYRISRKTGMVMIPDAKLRHQYSVSNRLDIGALKKMEIRNYRYVFNKYRKTGFFSVILFYYSLTGLILIDLIQLLSNQNMTEFKRFRATIRACMNHN